MLLSVCTIDEMLLTISIYPVMLTITAIYNMLSASVNNMLPATVDKMLTTTSYNMSTAVDNMSAAAYDVLLAVAAYELLIAVLVLFDVGAEMRRVRVLLRDGVAVEQVLLHSVAVRLLHGVAVNQSQGCVVGGQGVSAGGGQLQRGAGHLQVMPSLQLDMLSVSQLYLASGCQLDGLPWRQL